ncbi:unnamed protein product [Schistosoma margrebowiei]|uniref:Uncharacterized protein n=1 Tax=Schistosoma margrebowiei TaxID=48269 RepID=A0A183LPB2_9TREM|nr:unnamed protein product [Schistosoma margrebowiei]
MLWHILWNMRGLILILVCRIDGITWTWITRWNIIIICHVWCIHVLRVYIQHSSCTINMSL